MYKRRNSIEAHDLEKKSKRNEELKSPKSNEAKMNQSMNAMIHKSPIENLQNSIIFKQIVSRSEQSSPIMFPHSYNESLRRKNMQKMYTISEDSEIRKLKNQNYNWCEIARILNSTQHKGEIIRNGKQIRERFNNHLDPHLKSKLAIQKVNELNKKINIYFRADQLLAKSDQLFPKVQMEGMKTKFVIDLIALRKRINLSLSNGLYNSSKILQMQKNKMKEKCKQRKMKMLCSCLKQSQKIKLLLIKIKDKKKKKKQPEIKTKLQIQILNLQSVKRTIKWINFLANKAAKYQNLRNLQDVNSNHKMLKTNIKEGLLLYQMIIINLIIMKIDIKIQILILPQINIKILEIFQTLNSNKIQIWKKIMKNKQQAVLLQIKQSLEDPKAELLLLNLFLKRIIPNLKFEE